MKKQNLPGGYVRLTPDKGKRLYHPATSQYYSEVVVKESQATQFIEENYLRSGDCDRGD